MYIYSVYCWVFSVPELPNHSDMLIHAFTSFISICFILCHFVFPNSCKTLIVKGSHNSTVYKVYVLGFWTGYCLKEHCVSGNGSVPIRRWRSGPLVENDSFCHTQQNSYFPILSPGVCHELIQFLKHSNAFWISDTGRSVVLYVSVKLVFTAM
jgi:hypothetical protein